MIRLKKGSRSSFSQFQERAWLRKRKEKRKEKAIFRRNIKRLFLISCSAGLVYFSLMIYERWQMDHNSIATEAIIVRVKDESYAVNAYGNSFVNHFYLSYKYKVKGKHYRNLIEVRFEDANQYFDQPPQVGDTIKIRYQKSNPKKAELIKKR